MSCVLLLLMVIGVVTVVLLPPGGCPYPSFYIQGDEISKVTESIITLSQSGFYLYLSILHIFL
jgi:hypothetical protein